MKNEIEIKEIWRAHRDRGFGPKERVLGMVNGKPFDCYQSENSWRLFPHGIEYSRGERISVGRLVSGMVENNPHGLLESRVVSPERSELEELIEQWIECHNV